MNNNVTIFIILTIVFGIGCAGSKAKLSRIADGMHAAEQKHDIVTINKLATSIPNSDLTQERISKYSNEELILLYKALRKTAFYSPDNDEYILRQEKVFNEKVRRNKYSEKDIERMVSSFLSARMFKKARSLKKQFPKIELPDIPKNIITNDIPQSATWQAYEVSDNGRKIELKVLPLSSGPKIVIVISPGCGSVKSAIKTIFANNELYPIFLANSIMITRRSDFVGVEEAKKQFDFTKIYVVHKSKDFHGFYFQSSPYFYFIKDGKILHKFKGWGSGNNSKYGRREIHKGLSAIGIKTKVPIFKQ